MGETDTAKQGTPQKPEQSSGGEKGNTSTLVAPPKSFTEADLRKVVSDALAEQGRKHKAELDPIIAERDTFKSQSQNKEIDLEEIAKERDDLKQQIDELASDDPGKGALVKRDRALKEQAQKLKDGLRELEAERQKHSERLKRAETVERDVVAMTIAEEYEGAQSEKLIELCKVAGVTSEEGIRKMAGTLWEKKNNLTLPLGATFKPDSGQTSGGKDSLSSLPPQERIKEAERRLRLGQK